MEKNCNNCGIENSNCVDVSNWKSRTAGITKENPKTADHYEILRDCTLESLVEDGNIEEAQLYVAMGFHGTLPASRPFLSSKGKVKELFKEFPELLEIVIPYLIKYEYIKLKTRVPNVGDVWKHYKTYYQLIKKIDKKKWELHNLERQRKQVTDFSSKNWKFVCDYEELEEYLSNIPSEPEKKNCDNYSDYTYLSDGCVGCSPEYKHWIPKRQHIRESRAL